MNAPVTLRPKRYAYVFQCIGCGLLNMSDRRDRMTCSTACRVGAHRSGALSNLRQRAAMLHFPAWMGPQMQALLMLRPDLGDRIMSGELELDDVRGEVWAAFWERLTAAAPEGAA